MQVQTRKVRMLKGMERSRSDRVLSGFWSLLGWIGEHLLEVVLRRKTVLLGHDHVGRIAILGVWRSCCLLYLRKIR